MNQEVSSTVYASTLNGKLTSDELLKREAEYPYCSMIQFQLLQEYRNTDSDSFKKRSEKAAVYFPDLLKLNWQLHLINEAIIAHKSSVEFPDSSAKAERSPTLPETSPSLKTEPDTSAETTISSSEENNAPDFLESGEQEKVEMPVLDHTTLSNDHSDAPGEIEERQEPILLNVPVLSSIDSKPIENIGNEKVSNQDDTPLQKTTKDELTFEPLYTKDYFASLGIKLSDEPIANDKLGNQMKSFTQWLKSMKKINADKLSEPDEVVDKKIQTIAEKSNVTEDVVTESMADVLLLQGKHDKAIEMYEKLSLINPSKSAYFAAIIQVLKKA